MLSLPAAPAFGLIRRGCGPANLGTARYAMAARWAQPAAGRGWWAQQTVKSLGGCSGNRQVLRLYQEGVRSGRSEGEEDATATSTLAASHSPCIDTIHKYNECLKYNLGLFAPDHPEH